MKKKGRAAKEISTNTLKEICEEEFAVNLLNKLRRALDRCKYAFFNGDVSHEEYALVMATVKRKINETAHLIDEGFISALHRRFRRSSEIYRKSMSH